MYERFTDRARKVMQLANQEAQRFNHEYIGTEHILLGLVKEGASVAANVLKNLDIDLRKVRLEIEKILQSGPDRVITGKLPETPRAKKVCEYSIEEARNLHHNYVGTEHLLLGLLREEEGVAAQVLMNLGLKLNDVREEVLNLLGHKMQVNEDAGDNVGQTVSAGRLKTVTLDRFGLDLTDLARNGRLAPIVGRRSEMERLACVLGCRAQNNPILVGEPGVGKATTVKGLAFWWADTNGPALFEGRRLVAVSVSHLIAHSERFDAEALKGILGEIRQARNVVLYVDDLATVLGAGGAPAAYYAGSVFRSAIARGELQCITLATPVQYQTVLQHDSFLARHFRPILITPPSRGQTLEILRGVCATFAGHHGVKIQDEALDTVIDLAAVCMSDRCLPGSAISLLDETAAFVRHKHSVRRPQELREIESKLKVLNKEKEDAVAQQNVDYAASLRMRGDHLKKQLEQRLREWREQVPEVVGTVTKEAVVELAARIGGGPRPSPAREEVRPSAIVGPANDTSR